MSRGVVLWPEDATTRAVSEIWGELAARGLPSCATHTHRRHQPHVSLLVADQFPAEEVLAAVGTVPSRPIRLRIESAGVFPGGLLFLACVANDQLLDEQRRVTRVAAPLATGIWPHLTVGGWTPHLTLGWDLRPDQLAAALPLVLDRLPLTGWLTCGGVEDGDTGQNWTRSGDGMVRTRS